METPMKILIMCLAGVGHVFTQ